MRTKNILTFFAHPDDETLAAGATLKRLADRNNSIYVAIPNTGVYSRRRVEASNTLEQASTKLRSDCLNALSLLGIPESHVFFGTFSDNEIDRHTRLELIHWLEAILSKVKPDILFTHHRYCTNIDHQYCHEAAVVATRPDVHSHISLLCGEIPSSTGYLKPTQWEPNLYMGVSEEEIHAKIKAMQSYEGEARVDPHPRSPEVLKSLAKVRGSESGYYFAEAFMAQRLFGDIYDL